MSQQQSVLDQAINGNTEAHEHRNRMHLSDRSYGSNGSYAHETLSTTSPNSSLNGNKCPVSHFACVDIAGAVVCLDR
ncbi:hypothetical protein ACVWW5_006939 [Bradyrhizobium sp. LM3.4]